MRITTRCSQCDQNPFKAARKLERYCGLCGGVWFMFFWFYTQRLTYPKFSDANIPASSGLAPSAYMSIFQPVRDTGGMVCRIVCNSISITPGLVSQSAHQWSIMTHVPLWLLSQKYKRPWRPTARSHIWGVKPTVVLIMLQLMRLWLYHIWAHYGAYRTPSNDNSLQAFHQLP